MRRFKLLVICSFILINGFANPIAPMSQTSQTSSHQIEVLSWSPRIFLIKHFLTTAECDYLIREAKPQLTRSSVVAVNHPDVEISDDRTSSGMFFPTRTTDSIVSNIEKRIAELTLLPIENGEGLQILHYTVGAEYKPHFDYFDKNTEGGAAAYNRGGQRIATVIMYLADTTEGGETVFPEANLKIRPVKGTAVLFYNCTPDGKEDPLSLHGGTPVIQGNKWIATKWIRTSEFN